MLHKHLKACLIGIMLSFPLVLSAAEPAEVHYQADPGEVSVLMEQRSLMPSNPQGVKAAAQTIGVGTPPMSVGRGPIKKVEHPELKNPGKGAVNSISDLNGKWINQYPMLNLSLTGGSTAEITTTEGSNVVTISNFWRSGGVVKGTLNATCDTITITPQVVITRLDGTTMTVAPVNMSNGYPLRTQALKAVITSDGTIVCNTPWGIFYDRTQPGADDNPAYEKDDYANVYSYMTFERGTSSMSHINITSGDTAEYPVIASQIGGNVLQVKNFLGYGQTVNLILNRDNSFTCRTQVAFVEGSTPYYTRGDLVLNENNIPESWQPTFSFPANPSDAKLITFGNMSLFYGNSYWIGLIMDAKLQLNTAPVFPEPYSALEGNGTSSSPYLVKTYNDLCHIGEIVNSDENYDYKVVSGSDTIMVARPFLGKYIKLTADLDMTGYDFTPIGNATHFFAGSFDGGGHTIKGVNIYGGAGYAALFGYVGSTGSLTNLSLENISVSTSSIYGAALASRCDGKVENCHVRNSTITVSNGSQGAGGLTGTVYGMSNSTVSDCVIYAGDGYAGGLTAQAFGPISNCHVSATTIGGMVYNSTSIPPFGGLTATTNSSISDCSFSGVIDIPYGYYPATIGGLAGVIQSIGSGAGIIRSVAAGRLLGAQGTYARLNRIGGLAGSGVCDITDSYASGEIRAIASPTAGGLIGMTQYLQNPDNGELIQPRVQGCYSNMWLNLGTNYNYVPQATTCQELMGSNDPANPPTVVNSYFNSDITWLGSDHYGASTPDLTKAEGPTGFSALSWTFTAGAYPRLKKLISLPISNLTGSAILFTKGSTLSRTTRNLHLTSIGNTEFGFLVNGTFTNQGHYATINGSELQLNDKLLFGNDTIAMRCGKASQMFVMLVAPTPWQGEGTEASPWLIQTKSDLLALGKMTSESCVSFPNVYYKQTADIDMEYDDNFHGISYTNTDGRTLFHGTYDGGGFTMHRLKIGRLVWTVTPENDPAGKGTVNTTDSRGTYIGLFGEIASDGVVKNVNIASDCSYEVFASAGSIAGYNYGTIDNCRNYADIWGFSSWIGGIAGQVQKGATVTNCFNAGNVTSGYRNAGGITSMTQGPIVNCANTGNVQVISLYQAAGRGNLTYAGGISGGLNGGEIINCFNSGSVYAAEGYSGGITGNSPKASTTANYFNSLEGNVNIGVVECGVAQKIGGISGGNGTDGTLSNNYYDAMLNPQGGIESTTVTGVTGLATQQLVDGTTLSGLDISTWNFTANSYPVPTAYADEPSVNSVRKMYVIFAQGQDRIHIEADATLSQAPGLTWNLLTNNGFTIAGNVLKAPTQSSAIVNDTLCATLNGYSHIIPLQFIPKAPWDGDGSQANPYKISTPAHWNAIGSLMKMTGDSYDNTFFSVTQDIDFQNGNIEIIAEDPAMFKGVIDGNNHSLNNFNLDITAQYRAPIGLLAAEGEVKNLTLNGKINVQLASGSYAYASGLVAKCYGKLTNCINRSEITSNKGYVAGLAGYAYSGATFTGCLNYGKIGTNASAGYIAGIAAYGQEGCTYTRCGNYGELTTTGTTGYIAGITADSYESTFDSCFNAANFNLPSVSNVAGILARMYGLKTAKQIYNFKGCYNTGDIRAKSYIGGITAYASNTVGGAVGQYTDCYNTGHLTACVTTSSNSSPAAAGIVAMYKPGSVYSNCRNSGTITIEDYGYSIGGIAGCTSGVATQAYPILFENCHNSGNIEALNSRAYWTGGIIGHANDYVSLTDCSNSGKITALYGAGGLVGVLWGTNSRVDDSYNTGEVTVSTRMAGGIVACQGVLNAKTATAVISGCWNSGYVSSTSTTVGTTTTSTSVDAHAIGGIAGQFPGLIENCANFGMVKGATMVGGILGEPVMNASAARTRINGCYNAAEIQAEPTGFKAGITVTNQTAFWNDKNSLTNSYFATDWGTSAADENGSTAVTLAQLCSTNISDAWSLIGAYTLPVITTMRTQPGWKANAAAVILHSGNTFTEVKRNFHVGCPEGVTWSIAPADVPLSHNGDLMRWTQEAWNGNVILTAHCGEFSRNWNLTATSTTAVDTDSIDNAEIVSRLWFTVDGLQTAEPKEADGCLYIIVNVYSNGATKVERMLNK